MKVPKGVNIIDCEKIEVNVARDLIVINQLKDFLYFASDTILKKENEYYILQGDFLYIYKEKK